MRQGRCAYGKRDSTGAWVGRPEFKDGPQSFSQDQLCYNFETGKGLSRHAVTTEQDIVFHADRAKRQPDETVHVRDGKFTTCDADNPHFHFHLTKAIMVPNEKVVSGPLYLKFRKIPTPLALPFGWFPLQREKQSQGVLLPGYGDGGDLGFFLKDLGYYMPLGDHWDAKLLTDIYTGGSWAARVASNYNYRYRNSGSFSVSYQRQREGFAGTPGFGLSNNFFVRWTHSQDPRARPNSRFNASVNFGSSGNFQQNLNSTQEEYLSNTFQSSLQWTAKVPRTPFSTNISARHNQNSLTGNVTLTVPSLSLNMQRTSLSKLVGLDAGRSALLDGVAVTYSTQMENTIQGADSAFGAQDWSSLKIRNGLKHKVKFTSSSSVGFVSLSPSFTYDQYDSFQSLDVSEVQVTEDSTAFVNDTLRGFQSANEWRLGVTASTRFYGTFNMPGEGRVKAVRHVLAPSLGVSYNPERMREQSLVTDAGEVGWNPYALGRYVPNDRREAGSLNFGLSQNIEAKVADRETGELRKVKILDNLSTSGNFNFVADSLKLSDFQNSGIHKPVQPGECQCQRDPHGLCARHADGPGHRHLFGVSRPRIGPVEARHGSHGNKLQVRPRRGHAVERAVGLQRQFVPSVGVRAAKRHQRGDACPECPRQRERVEALQIGCHHGVRLGPTRVHADQFELLRGFALLGAVVQLDSLWGPAEFLSAFEREICLVARPQIGGTRVRRKAAVLTRADVLRAGIPAVQHHRKTHQEGKETDLVDAVHHAKVQPGFGVLFEQVERVKVV